jgi:hypothetical protein
MRQSYTNYTSNHAKSYQIIFSFKPYVIQRLTRYCYDCGDVGRYQYDQRHDEHTHEAESGVELFLPRLCVEPISDALVELFVERPSHLVEYQHLQHNTCITVPASNYLIISLFKIVNYICAMSYHKRLEM